MKLKALVIAVAAAAVPFVAQAEISVSGDATLGYNSANGDGIGDHGSEINVKGSTKAGAYTYTGSFEVDPDVSSSTLDSSGINVDEIRLGVSGPIGTIEMGETDNACDKMTTGGDWTEIIGASDAGDCPSDDKGTIRYSNKFGNAEAAISHNVDSSESSVGAKYTMGNTVVSLGHVQRTGVAENVTAVGLHSTFGPVQVKARANTLDDYSLHLAYIAGKNTFHAGLSEIHDENVKDGEKDGASIGWNRQLSDNTTSYVGVYDYNLTDDTEFGVGFIHNF